MLLSKSSKYGIRAVLYLASKCEPGKRFGAKVIARDLHLPEAFLGKIMQDLVRKKVIASIKGPNGGFYITPATLSLPVINIVEAIDGTESFHSCGMGLSECNDEKPCPIHNDYGPLRDGFFKILSDKTIGEFKKDIKEGRSFVVV